MLATTELECTLNRLMLLEKNVDDQDEKEWTHMVGENLANMIKQLQAIEKNMMLEKARKEMSLRGENPPENK